MIRVPIVGDWLAAKRAKWRMEEMRYARAASLNESMGEIFRQAENRLRMHFGEPERELNPWDRKELQAQAMRSYEENPLAGNGVDTLGELIMGSGVEFESGNETAKKTWKEWKKRTKFQKKEDEIPRRLIRDGEVFIRIFGEGDGTELRFVDPENVQEPSESSMPEESWTNGVITRADDVETILGYWVVINRKQGTVERVDVKDMIHEKIGADSTSKRGRSLLRRSLRYLKRLEKKQEYQHILMEMRLAIAFTQKIDAAPTDLAVFGNSNAATEVGQDYTKAFKAGTIVQTNKGVEYEFKSPQLDAGDVVALFREDKLMAAAGMGTPEHIMTMDAQNANFASTLAAESPFIRKGQWWRDTLAPIFEEIYQRVTGDKDAQVSWPRMEVRDFAQDATAVVALTGASIISDITAQERLGFDTEIEEERLGKQKQDDEAEDEKEFQRQRQAIIAQRGNRGAAGPVPVAVGGR